MATLETVQRDLARLESQLDLFEDAIGVIESATKCGLNPNPFYPELQATFERLVRNAKENEEYEREKQKEVLLNIGKEMEEMKQLIFELEQENKKLKEKEEKRREGRQLLEDLANRGGCSEEVLKAAEEVRESYEKCERFRDTNRQRTVICDVEKLKKFMTSSMTARNSSAGVSVFSGLATILLRAHPLGRAISGAVSALSLAFYLSKRKEIEVTWMRIQRALNADAQRFAALIRALEEFNEIWQRKFGFSIYSEKFQNICTIFSEGENDVISSSMEKGFKDHLSVFSDKELRCFLQWFGKDIVWKNIKVITSSHLFYSGIRTLSIFCDNPALQICVPGFFIICQMFLVVQDYSADKSKLSAVDQGIKRMKEELKFMEDLVQNGSELRDRE